MQIIRMPFRTITLFLSRMIIRSYAFAEMHVSAIGMKILIPLFLFLNLTFAAHSNALKYEEMVSESSIEFDYFFGTQKLTGNAKNFDVDVHFILTDISQSSVTAELDATTLTGGIIFATDAIRSPALLDVKNHPKITFKSTKISGTVNDATIEGLATIKGITKPITLQAKLQRLAGTEVDDIDQIVIAITGKIDRFDFGVEGYANEVKENVIFNFRIQLKQIP